MQVDMKTLYRMGQKPSANDLIVIRRHYCTQMYLNNLCTTKCIFQCKDNISRAFDYSYGEFVLKPSGAMVYFLRGLVGEEIRLSREHTAETPKNNLGEEEQGDVFAELARLYETTSALR